MMSSYKPIIAILDAQKKESEVYWVDFQGMDVEGIFFRYHQLTRYIIRLIVVYI